MKATFVLPGGAPLPGGGSRMVFRYANALALGGWDVAIVMPSMLGDSDWLHRQWRHGRYWLWRFARRYSPSSWMKLEPGVRLRWVPDLTAKRAEAGDVVIATAVQTAEAVAGWPASAGRKFYFVQGYETWDYPATRVACSWRLPLAKIAVSQWLCDLIAAAGSTAIHLPNGIDHHAFGVDRILSDRVHPTLIWTHHALPFKGSADVVAAIGGLMPPLGKLRLLAFGTGRAPDAEKVRVEYHRNPSQQKLRELYNEATIAVAPSHSEGWGLPACEALQCGCALAASDIGGHREFLRHNENALLHSPGDVMALGENILRLVSDDALRIRLAQQGVKDMAKLRFDTAVNRMKQILQQG